MEEELTAEFGIEHLVENGVPREDAERNIWLTDARQGHDPQDLPLGGRDRRRMAARPGALEVPAMVIWGRTDPYVPLEFGERLAERMKGELVVLECGHWWPFERPAETAAGAAAPLGRRPRSLSGSALVTQSTRSQPSASASVTGGASRDP